MAKTQSPPSTPRKGAGLPSTTGKPSGKGRDNLPPKKSKPMFEKNFENPKTSRSFLLLFFCVSNKGDHIQQHHRNLFFNFQSRIKAGIY